ncbi:MAG: hypothetical protein K2Z81_00690, partial [Cyanobacteria bacterium]|nr:hypothetical protein [Cyanobacteriota bacterium]
MGFSLHLQTAKSEHIKMFGIANGAELIGYGYLVDKIGFASSPCDVVAESHTENLMLKLFLV